MGKNAKNRVRYLAFGLRPSVSFCSASAKNFHFGASLVVAEACVIPSYIRGRNRETNRDIIGEAAVPTK